MSKKPAVHYYQKSAKLEAENKRLREAVHALADECEAYIEHEYPYRKDYPDIMRRYERDMNVVRELRDVAALSKETEE